MNNSVLNEFRRLAEVLNPEPKNWQWIGPWMSQRMFGITEVRAKTYAIKYGGTASLMPKQ
jgi:hypothetical protein